MNKQLNQVTEMIGLELRVQRRNPVWMVSLAAAGLMGYTEAFSLGFKDWPTTTQAVRAFQLGCVMIFGMMTFILCAGAMARDLSARRRDLLLCRPIKAWVYIMGIYGGNVLFALGVTVLYMMMFLAIPLCFGQTTLYAIQPFLYVLLFAAVPTILFCGALAVGLMCVSRRVIIALPVFLVYFMGVALFRMPMALRTEQPDVDLWDFSMRLYPRHVIAHVGAARLTDESFSHLLYPPVPELYVRALLYTALSAVLVGVSMLILKRMRSH